MPKITVEGFESFQAEEGQKLVLALEDNGVPIMHRCGGNARCTTCRVEIIAGDAGPLNDAEADIIQTRNFEKNIRLSCQLHCQNDMTVRPLMLASESATDAGPRPKDD